MDRYFSKMRTKAMLAAVLCAVAVSAGGCGSMLADAPMIGVPDGAPRRPANPGDYLPVHDVPTQRKDNTISIEEQARLEAELAAARDKQAVTTQR